MAAGPLQGGEVTPCTHLLRRVTRAQLRGTVLHLTGYGYLHRVATEELTTELVLGERDNGTEQGNYGSVSGR
ncbi:hypothetical protein GCM10010320_02360 [Streptomyces caelestis]|nr:hypothetical protein GCM10010320_02360 [Streptomyces caelestis]